MSYELSQKCLRRPKNIKNIPKLSFFPHCCTDEDAWVHITGDAAAFLTSAGSLSDDYGIKLPAMQAVTKHAQEPAKSALTATLAKSLLRSGHRAPRAPRQIPMEPRLENPHRAYVEITTERSCAQEQVVQPTNVTIRSPGASFICSRCRHSQLLL